VNKNIILGVIENLISQDGLEKTWLLRVKKITATEPTLNFMRKLFKN